MLQYNQLPNVNNMYSWPSILYHIQKNFQLDQTVKPELFRKKLQVYICMTWGWTFV